VHVDDGNTIETPYAKHDAFYCKKKQQQKQQQTGLKRKTQI
jgi:hypothetical protein